MAQSFKKSLFGFNCDQVTEYIAKTGKEYAEKELALKERAESLSAAVSSLNEEVIALKNKYAKMEAEISVYRSKCDEIELLSEKIGKLYLVANASSKAIMDNALKNAQISENEVDKNIAVIESAQAKLDEIKELVTKSSDGFSSDITSVGESLQNVKSDIEENRKLEAEKVAEFRTAVSE